jgi:hypothetical protein
MVELGRKLPAYSAAMAIFLGGCGASGQSNELPPGHLAAFEQAPTVPFNARNCIKFGIDNLRPQSNPKRAHGLPDPQHHKPTRFSVRDMGTAVPRGTPHNLYHNTVDVWHKYFDSKHQQWITTDDYVYDYHAQQPVDLRYSDHTGVHMTVEQATGNNVNLAGYVCRKVVK